MAEPRPLTQTPAAQLDWSRPGTPAASDFGDIYFSTDGGLDETRTVFLKGCGLPDAWEDKDVFTIAELGFGSGLNFLAAWQMWEQTARPKQRLHFVTIEKFPFDAIQLGRALEAWPDLKKFSTRLIDKWPGRVKGIHRLEFGSVTLTMVHEDVIDAFDQLDNLKANAWFLDGFSPSGNPAMWSQEVMERLAKTCAADARLATFSVAGAVRTALSNAGFEVRKMPGFGRKRHRLEADFKSETTSSKPAIEKALIIGAGIAGRSLAHALSSRHIPFEIIDNRAHPAASGNRAALVKPRFDLQDRPESRFFLSSYLHALRSYPEDSIDTRGVRQFPKSDAETTRFKKLVEQSALGDKALQWSEDALWIENARVIDPSKVFQDYDIQPIAFEELPNPSDYSHIFLAAGFGIKTLAPELGVRFSRGQLTWAEPVWQTPTAYGGYALNLDQAALIGATHDRLDDRDPFELRAEDDLKNLTALQDISGQQIKSIDRPSRASIRVTSRDTLPILANLSAAQNNQHSWAITGLGSRGFTFAPLLAEALIAHLCDEVGPLDRRLRTKFSDPKRYALK